MTRKSKTENFRVLDIVNCKKSYDEVEKDSVYICPAEGRSYKHRRCDFFGAYKEKAVGLIAKIEAVVDVSSEFVSKIRWINGSENEKVYEECAINHVRKLKPGEHKDFRTFILSNMFITSFIKDSKYGLRGSKQYLDLSGIRFDNIGELASILNEKKWSDFKL